MRMRILFEMTLSDWLIGRNQNQKLTLKMVECVLLTAFVIDSIALYLDEGLQVQGSMMREPIYR